MALCDDLISHYVLLCICNNKTYCLFIDFAYNTYTFEIYQEYLKSKALLITLFLSLSLSRLPNRDVCLNRMSIGRRDKSIVIARLNLLTIVLRYNVKTQSLDSLFLNSKTTRIYQRYGWAVQNTPNVGARAK